MLFQSRHRQFALQGPVNQAIHFLVGQLE